MWLVQALHEQGIPNEQQVIKEVQFIGLFSFLLN